ncbi:MAG: glycosyltransferase family 2 protein [Oscillospiraceae bacterium]|jgi:glycosyltransferase involved in cell wall biosynthesis
MDAKISVIVPVYNSAKYLPRCIESIIDQSYRNLEILLVNDGSIDDSLSVCNDYAKKDCRIVVIDKENGGVASARNRALDVATGDYIGFVDSDDYIRGEMYENLLKAITAKGADIAECGYCILDASGNIISRSRFRDGVVSGSYQCSFDFVTETNAADFIWNKLFRRSMFDNVRFPDLSYSEDYIVNIITSYMCRKKAVVSGHYYFYFKNENSKTSSAFRLAKMETVKAGKQAYYYHKSRYEKLCKYISVYICRHILFCYNGLKKSKIKNRRAHIREILRDYREFYPAISRDVYEIERFRRLRRHLVLFRLCPPLYNILLNIYNAINRT